MFYCALVEALLSNIEDEGSTLIEEFGTRGENNNKKSGATNHCVEKEIMKNSLDNDPDGFIGVISKLKKIKKFFLTGIADSVKESHILSYLEERDLKPTYLSIFNSKRKNIMSAKIHFPSGVSSIVEQSDFWPKFVHCKPWKSRKILEMTKGNTVDQDVPPTQVGKYSTLV